MIPQLRDLERYFPDELAVVGVHSGKYTAERETARVRDASIRLANTHPIINDRQFRTWRSYAVRAWPTLVVVDPEGYVLGTHAGEFTTEMLVPILRELVERYEARGSLDRRPLHFAPDPPGTPPRILRYPGKVVVHGTRVAIADSGHGRVLVGRLVDGGTSMLVDRFVGQEGPIESDDQSANTFGSPQGMAYHGDMLYVADPARHAVFAVDLVSGAQTMVVGIGRQPRTREDLAAGAIASPWDVTLVDGTLFIASAGRHQIHSFDLAVAPVERFAYDPTVRARALRVHCGTGREDIVDGPHAEAALAQPMAITSDGQRLYFADAESSAIRWADVSREGVVGTLVGTGLFDFGDRDGSGDEVRMQHQQGVAPHRSGRLLVADSYNDALKWVDPGTRSAESWVRGFHEPGGVASGEHYAYVADTNAHRVVTVSYETGAVEELGITWGSNEQRVSRKQ